MAGVDVGTAYLTIVPSARGFAGNLQREIGGSMESAGKDAGAKASKGFSGAFKAGMAGVLAGLSLDRIMTGTIDFVKDSIAEARESQKVGAITAQVIKTTGGAAKVSAEQIGALATAISNKTGVDDEAIQSGANLLLTFKNVKNEVGAGANVFDRATQAAVDLSAAGFGDMATTSKQLGKALNDPIAGITALARSGVTFTEQQKEQIKTLVASGKTLEAQKIILGEVESQVGGAAAASATAGEKMSTAFNNFKEQIGTALLPIIDKFATWMTDKVIPAASQLFDEFQKGEGAGGTLRAVLEAVGAAFGVLFDAGQKVIGFLAEHKKATLAAAIAVGALVLVTKAHAAVLAVQAAGGLISYIKNIGVVSIATKAWAAAQWLINVALNANPIGLVVIAIAALVAGIIWVAKNTTFFQDTWKRMTDGVAAAFTWLWNSIVAPIIRFILNGFANLTGGIASFLRSLSNIPGFGWAKDAADKMDGAAKKARDLAKGIKDIPTYKRVTIDLKVAGQIAALKALSTSGTSQKTAFIYDNRATGGPVSANQPYVVGDNPDGSWNRTTELFIPKSAGTIFNQSQLAALRGGGGLSQGDIDRLAYAMSRVSLSARIATSDVDRALGGKL